MPQKTQTSIVLPDDEMLAAIIDRDRYVIDQARTAAKLQVDLERMAGEAEYAARLLRQYTAEIDKAEKHLDLLRDGLRMAKKQNTAITRRMRTTEKKMANAQGRVRMRTAHIKKLLAAEAAKKIRKQLGVSIADEKPYKLPIEP